MSKRLLWGMVLLGLGAGCRSREAEPAAVFANGPPGPIESSATDNRVSATAPPPAPAMMDREVAGFIRQKLRQDPALAPVSGNVEFTVDKGVVTLRGTVPTQPAREELVRHVGKLAGVDRIEDQLRVGAP